MLIKLKIENIVLISNAEIDFSNGLNILSGETGAGKSILIDSLMLLFGARYDKSLLRFNSNSGLVEGVFSLNESAKRAMIEMGFEDDDIAIINRRFSIDGKNEIRINGKISTASMLKSIMANLVDIYGQHDYLKYIDKNAQLKVLDYYVTHNTSESNTSLYQQISDSYKTYQQIMLQLNELGSFNERQNNIDFLSYQIKEIEESNTYKEEEDELVNKRHVILNQEKIVQLIGESKEKIDNNSFSSALLSLNKLLSYGVNDENNLVERLESIIVETQDISYTLSQIHNNYDFNFGSIDDLEDRLSKIRALKRKYGDFDSMQKQLVESKKRLEMLENCDEIYLKLQKQKEQVVQNLYNLSKNLSQIRKESAVKLSKQIEQELHQLGMENACFSIEFSQFPSMESCIDLLSDNGMDEIEFYLSANAGQPLKPFVKTVSGGEMSRFMLALKVIMGGMDKIPTLIFDEIDTGISGKVGQEVAKKLARLSLNHQILCVTHLPQIASMATSHFYISKQVENGQTITKITNLDDNAMISEISRLCGSVGISEKSESNALEMKQWSENYKKSIN